MKHRIYFFLRLKEEVENQSLRPMARLLAIPHVKEIILEGDLRKMANARMIFASCQKSP